MLIVFLDIIWLCIMLYLSHASGEHTSRQSRELHRITRINEHSLRIIAHLFCYVILGLLWSLTVGRSPWILVLALVSVLDEWTKKFVPGRHFDVAEMGLNILGAAIGVGMVAIFIREF